MEHFMVDNVTTGTLEDTGVTQGKIGNGGAAVYIFCIEPCNRFELVPVFRIIYHPNARTQNVYQWLRYQDKTSDIFL